MPALPGGTPVPQQEALAKARIAYQDFLALWKDADPEIPIVKEAKAEYARLQDAKMAEAGSQHGGLRAITGNH